MKIRETIVYWASDREIELEKEYQKLPKNTIKANMLNVRIKTLDLISCVFDPHGRIQANYAYDKFNRHQHDHDLGNELERQTIEALKAESNLKM